MKETKTISGLGKRYLSEIDEFSDGIPFGIVNKRLTDVGGTYCAINCKSNYIVIVPFRDLATSIESDTNNKYDVFKVYGGISKSSFNDYIKANKVKKLVVTYDSFSKLINWLESVGEDLNNYKVLVDEYHLILEDMDFRDSAINNLIDNVVKFNHYSFLSATPINTDFEFDFLKELPHIELDWGRLDKITPFKIKTPNVYKATVALINEFKKGLKLDTIDGSIEEVKELHIFINSVNGIAQICNSANLCNSDVRVVCADRIRNNIVLGDIKVSDISDSNAKINFYTKKGFQGCNVFSNNALVVVVSDAKLDHTLVDIESTLCQIIGRLRSNNEYNNIFKHKVYHIYSTNNKIKTEDEFNEFMELKRSEANAIYNDLHSKDSDIRSLYISRMNFSSDFLSVNDNNIYINERKEQLFRYKFELKKSYSSGLMVRNKYSKSTKFNESKQCYLNFDGILLSKIVSVKLEDLYNMFLEDDDKTVYELEYPEFFEYSKYITLKEMNSAKWNKDKINKLLFDKKSMSVVHRRIYNELNNEFISLANLKSLYSKHLLKCGLDIKPKATLIEDNMFLYATAIKKNIDGLTVKGYDINKFRVN